MRMIKFCFIEIFNRKFIEMKIITMNFKVSSVTYTLGFFIIRVEYRNIYYAQHFREISVRDNYDTFLYFLTGQRSIEEIQIRKIGVGYLEISHLDDKFLIREGDFQFEEIFRKMLQNKISGEHLITPYFSKESFTNLDFRDRALVLLEPNYPKIIELGYNRKEFFSLEDIWSYSEDILSMLSTFITLERQLCVSKVKFALLCYENFQLKKEDIIFFYNKRNSLLQRDFLQDLGSYESSLVEFRSRILEHENDKETRIYFNVNNFYMDFNPRFLISHNNVQQQAHYCSFSVEEISVCSKENFTNYSLFVIYKIDKLENAKCALLFNNEDNELECILDYVITLEEFSWYKNSTREDLYNNLISEYTTYLIDIKEEFASYITG